MRFNTNPGASDCGLCYVDGDAIEQELCRQLFCIGARLNGQRNFFTFWSTPLRSLLVD
jgi:hypothetical protein